MPTLQQAQQKWERSTANAGSRWKAGVTGKEQAYCRGLAAMGVNEQACLAGVGRDWSQGTAAVSAQDFQANISGKGSKWAQNWLGRMNAGR